MVSDITTVATCKHAVVRCSKMMVGFLERIIAALSEDCFAGEARKTNAWLISSLDRSRSCIRGVFSEFQHSLRCRPDFSTFAHAGRSDVSPLLPSGRIVLPPLPQSRKLPIMDLAAHNSPHQNLGGIGAAPGYRSKERWDPN
jgi:hypothetical protein